MRPIVLGLLVAIWLSADTGGAQEDRQQALALWERAVAAKGGRDRLAAVKSFAILEKTALRRTPYAGGKIDQIVCELPDLWWEFLDYRPGLMGYSVRVVDTRTGRGWASHGQPARPLLRLDTDTAYRLRQLQYVYFLETRWVQPAPMRASRARHGLRTVDRVETQIDGDLVVFDLDRKTHLPIRIETARRTVLKPPRPGVTGRGLRRYVYELDGYHEVDGIHVPGRVRLGGDEAKTRVEINPPYDPSIFSRPPAADFGVDSWRKRAM